MKKNGHINRKEPFLPMTSKYHASYGQPDLFVAGLSVWLHSREFEDNQSYVDGNWLNVTFFCTEADYADSVSGPYLHLDEVIEFRQNLLHLKKTLSGRAILPCIEPEFTLLIKMDGSSETAKMVVQIKPYPPNPNRPFRFTLTPGDIDLLIMQCNAIETKFPIRGDASEQWVDEDESEF